MHQADTLYLPHDETRNSNQAKTPAKKKGRGKKKTTVTTKKSTKKDVIYKYALVVVDLATNNVDAEPLLSKSSDEATKAIQKIYKRKYLSKPHTLEVDDGTEFRGEFKDYFSNIELRVKRTGRHRAQANVEGMNSIISNLLQRMMIKESIIKRREFGDWVTNLPTVIKVINEYFSHKPIEIDAKEAPPTCKGDSCNILAVGTKVRIILEVPVEFTSKKRQIGKFRVGDTRWENKIRHITQIFMRPANPPMYKVDDIDVAYTKNQLQVVEANEKAPKKVKIEVVPCAGSSDGIQEVQEVIGKKKIGNKVHYNILWSDGEKSYEPRTGLIAYIPELIREYENNNKKK